MSGGSGRRPRHPGIAPTGCRQCFQRRPNIRATLPAFPDPVSSQSLERPRAGDGGRMKRALSGLAAGMLATGLAVGSPSAQTPANLPEYLANISGNTASNPSDVATRDVLQLDIGMFSLYDRASNIYRRNLLAKHPIILAMFTNEGGRLMLFRPGQDPIDAPKVPKVYQILESTGHSTMALRQGIIPSVNNPADKRWIAPMAAY